MKTDSEIYKFCRANYYCACDEDEDGYNDLCEMYEYCSEETIEEMIQNDVKALQRFMRGD